jgi:hypothetical protein
MLFYTDEISRLLSTATIVFDVLMFIQYDQNASWVIIERIL